MKKKNWPLENRTEKKKAHGKWLVMAQKCNSGGGGTGWDFRENKKQCLQKNSNTRKKKNSENKQNSKSNPAKEGFSQKFSSKK